MEQKQKPERTDPRTEAAREWVLDRVNQYQYDMPIIDAKHMSPQVLALIDYIVELEKRPEQWQDYIRAGIERKDDE